MGPILLQQQRQMYMFGVLCIAKVDKSYIWNGSKVVHVWRAKPWNLQSGYRIKAFLAQASMGSVWALVLVPVTSAVTSAVTPTVTSTLIVLLLLVAAFLIYWMDTQQKEKYWNLINQSITVQQIPRNWYRQERTIWWERTSKGRPLNDQMVSCHHIHWKK